MSRRALDDGTIDKLDKLERRGRAVQDKIVRANEHLTDLYEQRRTVFLEMLELGESKAGLARRFHVAPMTISFAIGEGRKPKESRVL